MTEPGGFESSRAPARAVFGAAVALHLALLRYFTPPVPLFSGTPVFEYDYALHGYQVDRARKAFEATGHLWSYDPFSLAGQPANVFEDVTNKMLELFVIVATHFGLGTWVAFNLYIFLLHASVPFVAWSASRLFGLSRLSAALTALFWVALWHFDSFLHWCWYVGMMAWGVASMLIVLITALMYRAIRDGSVVHYVCLASVAAFATLLHPFAPVTLVLPLAVLYARSWRTLKPRDHAFLLGGAALAASTTAFWLGPALLFRRDLGDVDAFLWPPPSYVFLDWFDFLKDVLMTGQPVRTAFRTAMFVVSAIALVRLRRERDDRFAPFVTLAFGSFALAYLSGYSAVLRQTQPYRSIGPAALAAALVAASELPNLASGARAVRLPRDGRALLIVSTALAVPALVKTCLGYMPTLVPDRTVPRSALRPGPLPGTSNDEYPPAVLGHSIPPREYPTIARYLENTLGQRGRAVVFDWVLAEYLATFSSVPIVGGIPQRNVPQVAAHPLRHDFSPLPNGEDPFERYLSEYAAGAVVTTGERNLADDRTDLLELERVVGDHRVYRVRKEPSYFERGSGRVTRQALNLISIADAIGPDLVLRFHFLPTLVCRPNCTIERADSERDAAGFVRVKNPPPAFDIENAYRVVR